MTFRGAALPWALALSVAGCVPATEERDPRGAAGVVVEPSPAARGEAFTTSDGFTVRFERFAFMANQQVGANDATGVFQSSDRRVWGAARGEVDVPALPVRRYNVDFRLNGFYLSSGPSDYYRIEVAEVQKASEVDPSIVERFLAVADNHRPNPYANEYSLDLGPTVVFALRAEGAGRTYSLSLALETHNVYDDPLGGGIPVEVTADAVAFARWEARVERLLDTDGQLRFSDLAAADDGGDRDGQITPAELRAVKMNEGSCDEEDDEDYSFDGRNIEPKCATLIDRLATRASAILSPQP